MPPNPKPYPDVSIASCDEFFALGGTYTVFPESAGVGPGITTGAFLWSYFQGAMETIQAIIQQYLWGYIWQNGG